MAIDQTQLEIGQLTMVEFVLQCTGQIRKDRGRLVRGASPTGLLDGGIEEFVGKWMLVVLKTRSDEGSMIRQILIP